MESSNWVPDAVRKTVFFALSIPGSRNHRIRTMSVRL